MDFLKIRQKARERAAARADGAAEPRAPDSVPSEPAAQRARADTASPPPAIAAPDVALVEDALAARLQGFTTWRPDSGAPPPVPIEDRAPDASDVAIPSPDAF